LDERAFVSWADRQRMQGLGAVRLASYQSRAREHLRWALAAEEILQGTPERFADEVRRDFQANLRYSPLPELTMFESPLTRRVSEMANAAILADDDPNRYPGPPALPETVCLAILASPSEGGRCWPHECVDCGYQVPMGWKTACPVCRGGVGYYAFRSSNRTDSP